MTWIYSHLIMRAARAQMRHHALTSRALKSIGLLTAAREERDHAVEWRDEANAHARKMERRAK